jgi:hypothetical protein
VTETDPIERLSLSSSLSGRSGADVRVGGGVLLVAAIASELESQTVDINVV